MRRFALVLLAALGACSRTPPEFELMAEPGKFTSKAQVVQRFEEMAASASNKEEINATRPYDHTGYLTVKNIKTLVRFKGESGGLWVQGDVSGMGVEASGTEMDVRFSGNVAGELRILSGVIWFEKLPDLTTAQFRVQFTKQTIVVVGSLTKEQLRQLASKMSGPAEVVAFEFDLEPGRYKCSDQIWGTQYQGINTLTVFAKKP